MRHVNSGRLMVVSKKHDSIILMAEPAKEADKKIYQENSLFKIELTIFESTNKVKINSVLRIRNHISKMYLSTREEEKEKMLLRQASLLSQRDQDNIELLQKELELGLDDMRDDISNQSPNKKREKDDLTRVETSIPNMLGMTFSNVQLYKNLQDTQDESSF